MNLEIQLQSISHEMIHASLSRRQQLSKPSVEDQFLGVIISENDTL